MSRCDVCGSIAWKGCCARCLGLQAAVVAGLVLAPLPAWAAEVGGMAIPMPSGTVADVSWPLALLLVSRELARVQIPPLVVRVSVVDGDRQAPPA